MNRTLTGTVTSTQLGHFGSPPAVYGFVTVETDDNSSLQVKIDAYSQIDEFSIGDRVELEIAPLGHTKVLVVKKLHRLVGGTEPGLMDSAAEAAPA